MKSQQERTISVREREVVKLYALGMTYEQIGDLLFISDDTVRTHLNNVRRKCYGQPMRTVIYWFAMAGVI
jgi:DNA-binding CsgD family transcriptional regulator